MLTLRLMAAGGDSAEEHPHDWADRMWQNGDCASPGKTGRRPLREGSPGQSMHCWRLPLH